jgi:hypothetical protein
MKSPMGACNLRPLFFIFSYFLLLIFYCPGHPALPLPCPCPCLALPLPLPCPCPVSNFPFAARDRRRKLYKERAVFFFLLLPGTGGGSYTWNGWVSGPGQTDIQESAVLLRFPIAAISSSSSSSPVGGYAPLDSVTAGGGVRFDGSLVAGMDETSIRLDG